jgi:RTX calcium-binding nonapeptide repeat (4 copies)
VQHLGERDGRAALLVLVAVLLLLVLCPSALAVPVATLTENGAVEESETGATLTGLLLSETPVLDCHFELGLTASFGTNAPCVAAPFAPGVTVPVSARIEGLSPGTTYYWRLVATNTLTTIQGPPLEMKTLSTPLPREQPETRSSPPGRKGGGTGRGHPTPSDPNDEGLYVAYCSAGHRASVTRAREALASHAGWPKDQCLKMDKGEVGERHTLDGKTGVHNWLLGGYGNDTIFAGNKGDVIWGDYQPAEQSEGERDRLHGGAGSDWIYSSHGSSEIWTGAGNDHVALIYGHGTVHCNGRGLKTLVMRALSQNRHWKLVGCNDMRIEPYKA